MPIPSAHTCRAGVSVDIGLSCLVSRASGFTTTSSSQGGIRCWPPSSSRASERNFRSMSHCRQLFERPGTIELFATVIEERHSKAALNHASFGLIAKRIACMKRVCDCWPQRCTSLWPTIADIFHQRDALGNQPEQFSAALLFLPSITVANNSIIPGRSLRFQQCNIDLKFLSNTRDELGSQQRMPP